MLDFTFREMVFKTSVNHGLMNRESEGSFLEKPIRDIKRISKELNRTAKSIKTKLCLLDFISDADVSWLDKLQRKDYRNETKKK